MASDSAPSPKVVWKKSYSSENPVIKYTTEHSVRLHPVQQKLLKHTLENVPHAGMIGAPEVVQFNANWIKSQRAKKVIDVGVFTGFSTLAAALALPEDGKVFALDIDEESCKVGQQYWKEAGVDHKVELIIQPALKSLDDLIAKGASGTFDFAFIDADGANYENYYERCLQLLRPGGLICLDNMLQGARVVDETVQDSSTVARRALNSKLHKDERVAVSLLPIGDGLSVVFKL